MGPWGALGEGVDGDAGCFWDCGCGFGGWGGPGGALAAAAGGFGVFVGGWGSGVAGEDEEAFTAEGGEEVAPEVEAEAGHEWVEEVDHWCDVTFMFVAWVEVVFDNVPEILGGRVVSVWAGRRGRRVGTE